MTDKTEALKAAEPGSHPKAEKYGMPAEYAHCIVERHFGIADENASLAGGALAADIEMSKALDSKG